MFPLFKEHTSYGAVLAMLYPAALYLTFRKSSWGYNAVAGALLAVLTIATVLSYTRAAWLSLVGAGAVYMVYLFRWSKTTVWSLACIVLIVAALNYSWIASKFERNTTDSSEDLNEHVASVTNVSTDASNLERINRWNSAIRIPSIDPLKVRCIRAHIGHRRNMFIQIFRAIGCVAFKLGSNPRVIERSHN